MKDAASTDSNEAARADRLVTPERSVFGTRLPRPVGVGRHLLIVFVVFVGALFIAVVFSERSGPNDDVKQDAKRFSPAP
ncbi:MAG: hypothetical protein ACO3JL_03645 [Myxococcota bacterium]